MIVKTEFRQVAKTAFRQFHREFNGEGDWWGICNKCGGQCEQHAIGSLMPGEKEFIASWLKTTISEFEDLYLDKIVTSIGEVDVLKMTTYCRFLDSGFHCIIKPVKVVLCDVYPVAFEVINDRVDYYIDDLCPLSKVPKAAEYFKNVAVPALRRLNAPVEWYRAVALYDHFNFDYSKIKREQQDINRYESFTLEQILAARV